MKYAAIISALVLVLTILFVGVLWMNASIAIDTAASGVRIVEASVWPDRYDALAEQLRLDAVVGTPFIAPQELSGVEDYQFCVYTVTLRNDCGVDADAVEIQITPMAGDVLQVGDAPLMTVPAGSSTQATAVLLTQAGNHGVRQVTVTYYMWGKPFTLTDYIQ